MFFGKKSSTYNENKFDMKSNIYVFCYYDIYLIYFFTLTDSL